MASAFSVKVLFCCNYHHNIHHKLTYGNWKYVDSGKEAADLYIMNHAEKGDVVITQDIGLASTLLPKGVQVLSPRGVMFHEKDIQTALDIRFLNAKARKRGVYGKGPKPFRTEDRERFLLELTRILSKFAGINQISAE